MFVDSHCHLDLLSKTHAISDVVANAANHDVQYMQTICTKLSDLAAIIDIAEKFDQVYASVGVHPTDSDEVTSVNELIELAQHKKVIGLGETGLDYHYEYSTNKTKQKHNFIQHIIAAQSINLPVIVHTRDADDDTADIIVREMQNAAFPALIHCFTSSKTFAKKMLDIGVYISISGIITFKGASDLREIVKFLPLDMLLIETDSPYLAPVPMRGNTNQPAFVQYVADSVATIKQITIAEVAKQTTENFFHLFKKAIHQKSRLE